MARVFILSQNGGQRWWAIIDEKELAERRRKRTLKPGHIIVPVHENEVQTVVVTRELGYRTGMDVSDNKGR